MRATRLQRVVRGLLFSPSLENFSLVGKKYRSLLDRKSSWLGLLNQYVFDSKRIIVMSQHLVPELADCCWIQNFCWAEALTSTRAGDVIREDQSSMDGRTHTLLGLGPHLFLFNCLLCCLVLCFFWFIMLWADLRGGQVSWKSKIMNEIKHKELYT